MRSYDTGEPVRMLEWPRQLFQGVGVNCRPLNLIKFAKLSFYLRPVIDSDTDQLSLSCQREGIQARRIFETENSLVPIINATYFSYVA